LGIGKYYLLILLLVPILITTLSAFAQTDAFVVETDQSSYEEGDSIVISGSVSTILPETRVAISIQSPSLNLIVATSLVVAQDGTFTHTVLAEGPLWQEGRYIVRGTYGEGNVAEASFEFFKTLPPEPDSVVIKIGTSNKIRR